MSVTQVNLAQLLLANVVVEMSQNDDDVTASKCKNGARGNV